MKKKLAFAHNLAVGGAKRSFYSLLPLLARTYEVTVHEFEGEDNYLLNLASAEGIISARYPAPRLPLRLLRRLPIIGPLVLYCLLKPAYRCMAASILKDAPDYVLVSHCRYTHSPLLLTMLKQPVVYFCHEPPRSLYEEFPTRPYHRRAGLVLKTLRAINSMLLRYLDRQRVASAYGLIANSYYSAEVLYRVYRQKATPAQMGVDTDVFFPREISMENMENIVVSSGSLNPAKAHDFTIRCLAEVPKEIRPSLVLTSPPGTQSTDEKTFLEGLATELEVKLEFRVCTDDELAKLYSVALASCYTPQLEPAGLVSLESMACGTPVLGVAEGGLCETILHEKTGFLLPRKPEAFATALQRLATEPLLRKEMGRASVAWVRERFTWQRCADTVVEALERTIRDGKTT